MSWTSLFIPDAGGRSRPSPVSSRFVPGAVVVADRLRVGIVGDARWRYSAEADWSDAFQAEGHQVTMLHEREAHGPDVVTLAARSDVLLWVSSDHRLSQDVMRRAGDRCVTVAWHPDLFFGLRNRRDAWRDSPMWAAQFVFSADGGNDDEWDRLGVDRRWLLPGVRERWTTTPGRLRSSFQADVAFVGNDGSSYHPEWSYRSELVEALWSMCDRNGWRFLNPGGSSRRVERNSRMNDLYRSVSVTVGDSLCFDREQARYWSDRVFEATGRGGVLVMPEIDVLRRDAGDAVEFYRWGDFDDLEDVVAGLLADKGRRDGLREAGRVWCRERHLYRHRVRTLLEAVL
jgi:hypothetical protein